MSSASSIWFGLLVALHVVCALVGFGSLALMGIYGSVASNPERAGAIEEARRFFIKRDRAWFALIAVPFLGGGAVAVRDGLSGFGHLWIAISVFVWITAMAVVLAVALPARIGLRALLLTEEEVPVAVFKDRAKRLAGACAACDVLFLIALAMMIWQPGGR